MDPQSPDPYSRVNWSFLVVKICIISTWRPCWTQALRRKWYELSTSPSKTAKFLTLFPFPSSILLIYWSSSWLWTSDIRDKQKKKENWTKTWRGSIVNVLCLQAFPLHTLGRGRLWHSPGDRCLNNRQKEAQSGELVGFYLGQESALLSAECAKKAALP